MVKAKKATPKEPTIPSKKTVTKRSSFKRATSTPLSKGKLSVDVDAENSIVAAAVSSLYVTKRKYVRSAKTVSKNESIVGSPKVPPMKPSKRTGDVIDDVNESSPKKVTKKNKMVKSLANSVDEPEKNDISGTTTGRTTRKATAKNTTINASPKKTKQPKKVSPAKPKVDASPGARPKRGGVTRPKRGGTSKVVTPQTPKKASPVKNKKSKGVATKKAKTSIKAAGKKKR